MPQLTYYDPSSELMSFRNVPILGVAKGTFVKVAYNEDNAKYEAGSGGDGVLIANKNYSGTIEITLIHGSPTCERLTSLSITDRFRIGVGPFLLTSPFNTTKCRAAQTWLQKVGDVERGDESNNITFTLGAHNLWILPGSGVVIP